MTKITKKMFKDALNVSVGTKIDLSRRLNVSCSAISQYLERNPDMALLFDERRMSNVDKAEDVLFDQLGFFDEKNISAGERIKQKSAELILKALGKDKGWIEKQQIEHFSDDMKPTKIEIIMPNEHKNNSDNQTSTSLEET